MHLQRVYIMREKINKQMSFGEVDISQIELNSKSRDDIPQLLRGLQHIYTHEKTREKIFEILEQEISPDADKGNGRPGMSLWRILVMGILRLNLNWDYDRLCEMVNEHQTIRKMLGHGICDRKKTYQLQTLKDNVSLLTPEILNKINKAVVDCGHELLKKKDQIKTRCDSFVVETNVHYPTDINLLLDAVRKAVTLTAKLCETFKIQGWRQYAHQLRQMKKRLFKLQKMKRSTSKDPKKKFQKEQEIRSAYQEYIREAKSLIERVKESHIRLLVSGAKVNPLEEIEEFILHGERQIDQVVRRVIHGETIPHGEKVFSIFEPHTEWISKGKAGVPVELGLMVAVVEDEFKFLLNHCVMQKQTDKDIAVPLLKDTVNQFPEVNSCSFDKGFHSTENQEKLKELLDVVALPKKGKLSKADKERQSSEEYKTAKKKHSAVESAINALEVHGLDRCPDRGIDGFQRYVSLAILGRNIQTLGAILLKQDEKRRRRALKKEKLKNAA